jgi:5-deoxy-D-glucuronate isomerase
MIKYSYFLFSLGENNMSITTLLSPENAPLVTMKLLRIQLDAEYPVEQIQIQDEVCLYALIGRVRAHIDGVDYGLLGGRRDVRTDDVQALRASPWKFSASLLTLTLEDYTADLLVTAVPMQAPWPVPFVHTCGQSLSHPVGVGTHKRHVRELPVPPGYTIHMGETLNDVGAWSSWPDHSTQAERCRYAEHQEVFYAITPGYGLMYLNGTYANGDEDVDAVRIVRNDDAFATPLGSHPVAASPDAWLYYCWGYQSFLKKQYNKFAHHGVRQYLK